jgi:hypothetical protein
MGGCDQNDCWGDWLGCMVWIHLAQDMKCFQALVNAVMNLQVEDWSQHQCKQNQSGITDAYAEYRDRATKD